MSAGEKKVGGAGAQGHLTIVGLGIRAASQHGLFF